MSDYRTLLEDTDRAIQRRAAYYRNQVIAVVAIAVVTAASAVAFRSPAVLVALLLLVPLCGAFVVADARLLNRWRADLLGAWARKEVDLAAFLTTIRAHPVLPKDTLEAMLATLPAAGDLAAEQAIQSPTRRAIAAASAAVHDNRAHVLLMKVVASGVLVMCVLAATWTGTWRPLSGLLVLLPLPVLARWMARRRLGACEAYVVMCRQESGFSDPDYARIRSTLR